MLSVSLIFILVFILVLLLFSSLFFFYNLFSKISPKHPIASPNFSSYSESHQNVQDISDPIRLDILSPESRLSPVISPSLEALLSPFIDINSHKGLFIIPKPPIHYDPSNVNYNKDTLQKPMATFFRNYDILHREYNKDKSYINYLYENTPHYWKYNSKYQYILLSLWNIPNFIPNIYKTRVEIPYNKNLDDHIRLLEYKYKDNLKMNKVWISCTHLRRREGTFVQGFDSSLFPLKENSLNYLPPFVVIPLYLKNGLNNVECKMMAKNIDYSRDKFTSIKFTINVGTEATEVTEETESEIGGEMEVKTISAQITAGSETSDQESIGAEVADKGLGVSEEVLRGSTGILEEESEGGLTGILKEESTGISEGGSIEVLRGSTGILEEGDQ
ncbi:Sodium/potassium-transporting ATPase subunit beta-1 [Astathelohania contejeani]|uniref:Sodium/potassium-transporting ATPase subunit beta-1 n=1 Tax=Astathelohania contejeani TaxID=164912 RepID=A0ABQ7HWZ1_9MICR|nr:Sodium/potassium-transporting ATPase subunit beta-1 [Thelohania contejeani]